MEAKASMQLLILRLRPNAAPSHLYLGCGAVKFPEDVVFMACQELFVADVSVGPKYERGSTGKTVGSYTGPSPPPSADTVRLSDVVSPMLRLGSLSELPRTSEVNVRSSLSHVCEKNMSK